MQEGRIAQREVNSLQVVAFSDAYFAGCLDAQPSTTGGHLCIEGKPSHFPIHSLSKRQGSTASSTPAAECVAADIVLRQMLAPRLNMRGVFFFAKRDPMIFGEF